MKIPRIEIGSEAQSSAAMSFAAGLAQLLIRKQILSKEEVVELYQTLAKAKHAKGDLHSSAVEHEAGALLEHLGQALEGSDL